MIRILTLARLQAVDTELDDVGRRLRQVEQKLSDDPAVASARAALVAEDKHLAEERSALRERERQAQSIDAEIRDMERRLYGGNVTNPRELEGMEQDLQMHRRQRSELDDDLLERMEGVDRLQARVLDLTKALEHVQALRSKDVGALTREKETLSSRIATLVDERDELRKTIDLDPLRTYDHLRRTKAGKAVALLRHDACGACGMAVATGLLQRVRTGEEMVFCSGCGRILAP